MSSVRVLYGLSEIDIQLLNACHRHEFVQLLNDRFGIQYTQETLDRWWSDKK